MVNICIKIQTLLRFMCQKLPLSQVFKWCLQLGSQVKWEYNHTVWLSSTPAGIFFFWQKCIIGLICLWLWDRPSIWWLSWSVFIRLHAWLPPRAADLPLVWGDSSGVYLHQKVRKYVSRCFSKHLAWKKNSYDVLFSPQHCLFCHDTAVLCALCAADTAHHSPLAPQ